MMFKNRYYFHLTLFSVRVFPNPILYFFYLYQAGGILRVSITIKFLFESQSFCICDFHNNILSCDKQYLVLIFASILSSSLLQITNQNWKFKIQLMLNY